MLTEAALPRSHGRGHFSYREVLVHEIDNWSRDRVLAPDA